ncbi:DUF3857 domain-containing protein [Anaeromyxobacter sp. Red801]|uniref:DUF3857 domain-containing protein n=1 Tax=Anaeromyxobacter sp. Red801 TaxID=3411632 RepID=UPI003BA38946
MSRAARRASPRVPGVAAGLAALALACAGPRAEQAEPGRATREGLAALEQNDVARAEARLGPASRVRDPWARFGASLLARRALDGEAEAQRLLATVEAGPDEPIALVALRRLAELAERGPALAAQVDAGVLRLGAGGRLRGLAAYRARVARVTAAEVLGDHEAAAQARRENGAVSAWSIAGPFAAHHALDFGAPIPPDRGELPASVPGRAGGPAVPTRALPAPDGTVALDGEPAAGDVFALAADVDLARGGRYLVTLGTQLSARLVVDGALVHERRAFAAWLPGLVHLPVELARGRHRVVLEVTRGAPSTGIHLAFARADGAASDARFAAPPPGPPPAPPAARPRAEPALTPRALALALEPDVGAATARLLAARDAMVNDREAAKVLLAEALALRPEAAALRAARADATADDPSLDEQVARARAEADLREALRLDPGDAEARVELAALLRSAERHDDAEAVLAGLAPEPAARPAGIAARARAAQARGLLERAEGLAAEALRSAGSCDAADLAYELAVRRGAAAREDEAMAVLSRCRGGRERLAGHLRRRGDPVAERAALDPVVRARPWAVEPGLTRADALVAAGETRRATAALEAIAAIWPRDARVQRRLADARELSGDAPGARAARERALALDPADLQLRRALALEDGTEVLADVAADPRAAIRAYEAAGRRNGASTVMVLDAAYVDVHPGGAATERTQQIVHVLDQQGVEQFGEVTVPSGADVLALRTVKPDGTTLEPERAGSAKNSVSLAGLAPGDYVELDYVRAVQSPPGLDGYAADPFYFQVPGSRLFRSLYVVRAPAGLGLEADAHGMPAPAPARDGGREVLRAERRDVPAIVPEPDAPGGAEYLPFVVVGTGGGRAALQRAVADALPERTRATAELRAFARDIAAGGGGPAQLARAAYARVAQAVLGSGGGMGEDASVALSRGRGSRLAVLKAVLAELGIESRVALVRPYSADPAPYRFPALGLYAAPLLRVRAGGATFWLDPTARHAPFGAFPAVLAGCEALVLPEPGEAPEVDRTPETPLVEEGRETTARLVLAADGSAEASGTDRYLGYGGAELKAALERLDASQRRQAVEGMLGRVLRGVTVTEVAFAGEDDPAAPLEIRWKARVPELARAVEGGLVLDQPLFPARLGARLVRVAARQTPLLLATPERQVQRVEVVPPRGLTVTADAPRTASSPSGSFARTERVDGGALVRDERLELRRGRIAPEQYAELAAFAAAVDQAQERPLLLSR